MTTYHLRLVLDRVRDTTCCVRWVTSSLEHAVPSRPLLHSLRQVDCYAEASWWFGELWLGTSFADLSHAQWPNNLGSAARIAGPRNGQ